VAGKQAFTKKRGEIIRGRTAILVDTRAEVLRLLKHALDQIHLVLAGQPTDYQLWSLPRLASEIRQAMGEFSTDAAATLSTAAGKAWQLGLDLVDAPLEAGGIRIGAALGAVDTRQLKAMRAFMTDRIQDIGLQAANKINAEMGLVVIGVQSASQAISATRLVLGDESRRRATTIVRTELSRVYAVASFERLEQAAGRVPGLQKQWRKSGKLHPRLHHDVIDGQVRDVSAPFDLKPFGKPALKLMFPHDPKAPAGEVINCGCTMVPFKADWKVLHPGRAPGGLDAGPSIRELLAQGAPPGPRPLKGNNA
jgi:hypothetical protein